MLLLGLLPWSSIITYEAVRFRPATSHPKVVQERLGHATIATTLTYSHAIPAMQEEAAEKIDEGLRAALAG
jgi:integrase